MKRMALTSDLAKQIEAYINANKDCKTGIPQRLEIAGKLHELPVYRLPTSLLRYSVKNGRFAAEYRELVGKFGRELDPNDKKDVEEIEKLLLQQDKNATEVLKADLLKIGQRNPGVATFDGSLVNGNRRMAIFKVLQAETGDEKWRFLEVSILPPSVSERDVWRIEAGLQFSREERLDYGPTNRLLKFREGKQAGLSNKEIAATLYGGFTEEDIDEDLKRLELIDIFLQFIEKPSHYKTIEDHRWHEHFIDLRNFIKKEQGRGTPAAEINKVVKFAFDLIRNDIPHLELRDLGDVMKEQTSKVHLLKEIDANPTIIEIVNPKKSHTATKKVRDGPPPKGKDSPTMQLFGDTVEMVKAAEQKSKPGVLLNRALTNLKGIDLSVLKKNDAKLKDLVLEIDKTVVKIKKKLIGK